MVIFAIIALVLGVLCGLSGVQNVLITQLSEHSTLILYALMLSVGISIGRNRTIFQSIRQYHVKIFLIPAGIVLGSLAAGVLCALISGIPLGASLAISSGLGWYSLSGIMIADLYSAQLGSIAFLSCLMRELLSFFSIPFIARHFNKYTCIAPAAATSEDTTLPMMIRYTDEEAVVLSVFNGVICSAMVPILIRFFAEIL